MWRHKRSFCERSPVDAGWIWAEIMGVGNSSELIFFNSKCLAYFRFIKWIFWKSFHPSIDSFNDLFQAIIEIWNIYFSNNFLSINLRPALEEFFIPRCLQIHTHAINSPKIVIYTHFLFDLSKRANHLKNRL